MSLSVSALLSIISIHKKEPKSFPDPIGSENAQIFMRLVGCKNEAYLHKIFQHPFHHLSHLLPQTSTVLHWEQKLRPTPLFDCVFALESRSFRLNS